MRCKIVILALEDTPVRRMFLAALINSLKFHSPAGEPASLTLISDYHHDHRVKQVAEIISPEEACGISSFGPDVPRWYKEQLAGLCYAASVDEEFSLIVPVGAFAISQISNATLLPRSRARTSWESFSYHPSWWKTAKELTKRTPISPWEGPSVFPAICSNQLSRWAMDIIARENGKNPTKLLLELAGRGKEWSALSVYATSAGSRFAHFHHDAYASQTKALMSHSQLWSDAGLSSFYPASTLEDDTGLFTYVHLDGISDSEQALGRLYACLTTEKLKEDGIHGSTMTNRKSKF